MKNLEHYLKLIIPLLGVAVAWGMLQTRIDNIEHRILKIETSYQEMQPTFLKIEVRLAEIQKDIQSLNEKLTK